MVAKGLGKGLNDLENRGRIRNCTDFMKMTMISNAVEDLGMSPKYWQNTRRDSGTEEE